MKRNKRRGFDCDLNYEIALFTRTRAVDHSHPRRISHRNGRVVVMDGFVGTVGSRPDDYDVLRHLSRGESGHPLPSRPTMNRKRSYSCLPTRLACFLAGRRSNGSVSFNGRQLLLLSLHRGSFPAVFSRAFPYHRAAPGKSMFRSPCMIADLPRVLLSARRLVR